MDFAVAREPQERYDYELLPKTTKSFGDVVVVHYLVRDFYRDGKSGKVLKELGVSRITHTWQRRGDTWQIITGISNDHVGEWNERAEAVRTE